MLAHATMPPAGILASLHADLKRAPAEVARPVRHVGLWGLGDKDAVPRGEALFLLVFAPVFGALCEEDSISESPRRVHKAFGRHTNRPKAAENHTACWAVINPPAHALGE